MRRPGGRRVWLCSRDTTTTCNRPSEDGNGRAEDEKGVRAAVPIRRRREGLDRGAGGTGACGDWYELGGEGVGEAQPLLSLAQNPDKPKQGPTFLLQFTLKY